MAATPMPVVLEDHTQRFWDEAAQGRLAIAWCTACDRGFHYPRPFCPRCWSRELDWRIASGRGTIYALTVIRQSGVPEFKERLPYVVALVDLDEGVRMLTNVDANVEDVHIGDVVEVQFRDNSGLSVPEFRLVPATSTP